MSPDSKTQVRILRRFTHPPVRVFDAWLDPAHAGKWLFSTATGKMQKVEINPRIGGRFVFIDRRDGEDVRHEGEYLEMDRPRRLVFQFMVPKYSVQVTRVALDIAPSGAGSELTLTHFDVPPEMLDRTESGWATVLEGLAKTLG